MDPADQALGVVCDGRRDPAGDGVGLPHPGRRELDQTAALLAQDLQRGADPAGEPVLEQRGRRRHARNAGDHRQPVALRADPALPLHVRLRGESELGDQAKLDRRPVGERVLRGERRVQLLRRDVGRSLRVPGHTGAEDAVPLEQARLENLDRARVAPRLSLRRPADHEHVHHSGLGRETTQQAVEGCLVAQPAAPGCAGPARSLRLAGCARRARARRGRPPGAPSRRRSCRPAAPLPARRRRPPPSASARRWLPQRTPPTRPRRVVMPARPRACAGSGPSPSAPPSRRPPRSRRRRPRPRTPASPARRRPSRSRRRGSRPSGAR